MASCEYNILASGSTWRSSGVTFSASWTKPNSITNWLVGWVARLPARVQTKLLIAFLSIVGLLIVLGAVGLQVLSGVNDQTNELIKLQRRIAAYRQVQHDTTTQLYGISTALLLQDNRMLDTALRQLNQFGYDLERMEFVAKAEVEVLGQVRQEYEKLTAGVTHVAELVRAGRTEEARKVQLDEIIPSADRLERLTNQLVNMAEADMVAAIETTEGAYGTSRLIVVSFAVGSILLALGLGYIISWSLIEPVKKIETRLSQIAAGDFAQRVAVANRDELGVLAANVNQTSDQLGRLYQEIETRTQQLDEALQQQTATADVLKVISRSTFDLQVVLDTLVESAVRLCRADKGGIVQLLDGVFRYVSTLGYPPSFRDYVDANPLPALAAGRGSAVGRVIEERRIVQIEDVTADPDYRVALIAEAGGFRTVLAAPLLREGDLIGVFVMTRAEPQPFSPKEIALVETFADQAVIAIENARLFEAVQARTRELAASVGELEALGEVSKAVNSTLDLDTVLKTIVAKAVQLSATDAGTIYVFSSTRQQFRPRANFGMSDELIAAVSQQTIGLADMGIGDAPGRCMPVQFPDLGKETSSFLVRKTILDAGYRGILIVPLLRPNKIVGALVVRRHKPGAFDEQVVHLLETFAAQSVVAIQNAKLFREIEEKREELEAASRHKSQFLANMSHELRTPLNSVLGFTELLVDGIYGELPDKAKATVARVQANGRHLLGLINDVLDLSKIEAGQLTLAIEDYSVAQIVRSTLTAVEPLARAKGLELSATVAENLPIGRGDERRLTQILLNLAGNAVKFTETGAVDILADAVGGNFEITVRDTGPGIASKDQALIFEEFQQVDNSSTRQKGGTGLGLAISKRIAEMHGGTLDVESVIGSGSTFRLKVPIRMNEDVRAA
ncbi:MAG: GAF domain-containing protein [Mesorhizobium sp.]|nr:GAF domain-containing protein [Mesorhizobium sp. M1A.F.Ca.IN.020.04.1.1]RUW11923.1 GAF domain-containing protein [Mesorhizobium sp. M1A.F.Ca.IN.020.03.1.1]RWF70238.1 MAG: GAF domain-containing protein [Mesorhizobium sp.]RWG16013.1 MAG: GAF domain-containing protein [Mesorhizobium sp.]RWG26043.1 MAG: GAF domain-containing protein [Mesorhizobium sp.]